MFPGNIHLIRPVFHQRHREDDQKYREHHQKDQSADSAENHIPQGIFPDFNIGNLIIADVIFFKIMEQRDGHHRRNKHHHGDGGTGIKIRDTSKHLIVEHRSYHIVFAAHRRRNTVIGKAEEKALHKGCRQRSQKGPDHRCHKCGQRFISHDPGYDGKFLIDVLHGIGHQEEGYRQRIDHISQKQAVESVDLKELSAKNLCDQSLFTKRINDGKSVSDGRKQHRDHRRLPDESFIAFWNVGIIDRVSQ